MRIIRLFFLLALLGAAAFGDDYDDFINGVKTEAGFSAWPKGGALKRGLNFQPSNYAQLAGFTIASDGTDTADLTYGIVRSLQLNAGATSVGIQLGVAFGSTDNAQELLIRTLAASEADFAAIWQRGDPALQLGDVNFVGFGGTASNEWGGSIAFVRNNVMCVLTDENPVAPFAALAALAAAIDANIQSALNLTSAQFNALRPQVLQFSPAMSSLSGGDATLLKISIVDPSSDPFTQLVTTDGSLDILTDSTGAVEASATDVEGLIPINLVVVDASLLFNVAQTTVRVTP